MSYRTVTYSRSSWDVCAYALDGAMGTILPRVIKQDTFSGDDPMVFRGKVPEDRPRFLVAYQNGLIQLMRNEADPSMFMPVPALAY